MLLVWIARVTVYLILGQGIGLFGRLIGKVMLPIRQYYGLSDTDSIVPVGAQGTQAYDRYAYVNNNPLRYTDSSGHRIDNEGSVIPHATNMPALPNPSTADARMYSLSGTFGVGPYYYTASIDIVITDDEIGVFTVSGAGPAVGGTDLSGVQSNAEDADSTWVTPQIGLCAVAGPVFGDELRNDVSAYEGSALVVGGSLGPVSGEVYSSLDPEYGIPNLEVAGYAYGPGIVSATPIEAHIFHVWADERETASAVLTWLGDKIGLIDAE